MLILKFVWFTDSKPFITIYDSEIKLILLAIGTAVVAYFSQFIESASEKKILKYEICKVIESKYGLIDQNLLVPKLKTSKIKLNGRVLLRILKALLFFLYLSSIIFVWSSSNQVSMIAFLIFLMMCGAIIFAISMEVFYYSKEIDIKELVSDRLKSISSFKRN